MKYYRLTCSCDKQRIGSVYPQVQKMRIGYNYDSDISIHKLSRLYYNSFPDFEPDLDGFVLHGRAKLTDFLSNAIVSDLLISSRVKVILENCNMGPCKFYPANVIQGKNQHDYFLMHHISNIREHVDYKNSRFYIRRNFLKNNLGYIEISTESDFCAKEQNLKVENPNQTLVIWAESIKINLGFDREIDLFEIGKFDSGLYISEKIFRLFQENSITGIDYEEADNILF